MARFNPIKQSFVAGEFSPRLEARSDLDDYFRAARQTRNGIVLPHGGFQRRSGTRHVAEVKDSTKQVQLISFTPAVGEGVVVEMGDLYMRFYKDGAQVEDGNGNPLELATPYKESELLDIQVTQSVDVMWIVHPLHFPRKLKRTQANPPRFTFGKLDWRDGHAPLRRPNDDLENPVNVTGSNPSVLTWRNDPVDGGLDTSGNFDLERAVRMDDGQNIGWYEIVEVTATNQAKANLLGGSPPQARSIASKQNGDPLILQTNANDHGLVEGEVIFFEDPTGGTVIDPNSGTDYFIVGPSPEDSNGQIILSQFQVNTFPNDNPVNGGSLTIQGDESVFRAPTDWALGAASQEEGFRAVTFHEGRLAYGGTETELDRFWLSVSDDFDNFELVSQTLDLRDAAADDRAIERRTLSTENNAIQWMQAANRRLFVGTSGGEFQVRGANNDLLTPTGTQVIQATARGSIHLQPAVIDNQIVFAQQNGERLRRLRFDVNVDGQVAEDVSILAEHILDGGVFDMAYQQDPDSVLWAVRGDGRLIGWTIEAQQNVIGAHEHQIGGEWAGIQPVVEAVASLPSPTDRNQNQLWVAVRREVNGQTKRYIEFFEDVYTPRVGFAATDKELIRAVEDGVFVDSSASLDNPVAISGITQGSPTFVQTPGAHGLSVNDTVRFRDIVGMEELNQVTATVTGVVSSTVFSADVDSSNFNQYKGFGSVRKEFASFSGLDHLEGETVSVLADGAVHPQRTVSSGSFTLNRKASIVHVGLPYEFFVETTRFVTNGSLGTLQGQKARVQRVNLRLHESLGGEVGIGPDPQKLEEFVYRQTASPMNRAIPLFTGDKEVPVPEGWTTEPTVFIRQPQPLPMTVLGVMPRMEANER